MPLVGSVEECAFEDLRVSRSCPGGAVVKFCAVALVPLGDRCRENHGCMAFNGLF